MATVAPSGAGDQPAIEKRDGGTVANGGGIGADSPMTVGLSLADMADDQGDDYGSKVIAKVDGGEYSDRVGISGVRAGAVVPGVTELGYDATATEWVMEAGNVTTTLGGVAYDGLVGAAAGPNPTRDNIYQLETTRDYGQVDIDVYAMPSSGYNSWVTRTGGGQLVQFIAPASGDGVSPSNDEAANTTLAVPGELTYMFGSLVPKNDVYKAKDSAEV